MSGVNKYFVTDCETTGTDPESDDVLQIAFLEVEFDGEYWVPGKEFEEFIHTKKEPDYDWAKENLSDVYKKAQTSKKTKYGEVHRDIIEFFKKCGASLPVNLIGYNITVFDLNFYESKGLLKKLSRDKEDKEKKVGDYHYRVYEMAGVIEFAENFFLENRNEIVKRAINIDKTIVLPSGRNSHDALYDCYQNIKVLNGIIKMFRDSLDLHAGISWRSARVGRI